jgi:hypothetical protein
MGGQSGRGSVKGVSRGSLGNGERDAKDWGKAFIVNLILSGNSRKKIEKVTHC